MKKLWKRIAQHGKITKIEFIINVLALAASALLLLLDFSGIVPLTIENLISIAIVLLGILVASSLIERYGILSSIFENLVTPNESHAYLAIRSQYDRLHPIDDYYSDITEMYIMAIANTSFLGGNGIMRLRQAAQKGIKVKLLSINPNSELASIYETSKILSSVSIPLSRNIESYKKARRDNQKFQENIVMKVCDKIIPYSLIILKKNGQVTTIKVDLYSNNVEYTERRSIIIPPTDIENIGFFLSQWEFLWSQDDNIEII